MFYYVGTSMGRCFVHVGQSLPALVAQEGFKIIPTKFFCTTKLKNQFPGC